MKHIKKDGFTLIELLIVISIIGVLAGLGMAGTTAVRKAAKKSKANTTISALSIALANYKSDIGIYPPDESSKMVMNHLMGFVDNVDEIDPQFQRDPDWHGPYYADKKVSFKGGLKNEALVDPWNKPYIFRLSKPERNRFTFDIYSSGPDGIDDNGSKDDVGNW